MTEVSTRSVAAPGVALRAMPFPFRAMLAICSDLDETPDCHLYLDTLRLLNTAGRTRFGEGLGLEVGDTIYFDMPPGQFSYWNTDDRGRSAVRALIQSGHVDCLHSFGDLAVTRGDAERALNELARHGCRLEVWIDHATAPTNFGADIMRGEGDVSGAAAYHADLTCDFGIKYVWRGRVTSVIGQNAPRRLAGIFSPAHPLASGITVAKEGAKAVVAATGHPKYRMNRANRVLEAGILRDGHPVIEFLRANPHFGGISAGDNAAGIGSVLTGHMLDLLVERGGASIIYTHLGKTRDLAHPFDRRGLAAFERLAAAQTAGRILVSTTRRLLGYLHASAALTFTTFEADGALCLDVSLPDGTPRPVRGDLDGITFYVPDPERTRVSVDRQEVPSVRRNGPDHTGRPSVSFPWTRLEFPL